MTYLLGVLMLGFGMGVIVANALADGGASGIHAFGVGMMFAGMIVRQIGDK